MAVWNTIPISSIQSGFRIDAEFYRQENLEKDAEINKFSNFALGSYARITDGEHGSVTFCLSGVRYLTAENVKQGYIDESNARFVDYVVDERNARARVNVGDVLISIKGTLGQVGVADDEVLPANMNRDVAIIKPKTKGTGYFIAAFLRSKFGQYQLSREGSGGVQQMITLSRLRTIRIPSVKADAVVSKIYKKALKAYRQSRFLYSAAERMLAEALKLDDIKLERPLSYTAKFSDVLREGRTDAEYYQIPYVQLSEHVKTSAQGCQPITELCDFLKPNIDPSKMPKEEFNYVELADINARLGVIDKCESYAGAELPSRARRIVRSGDVLASAVVGSIDKSAAIGKQQDGYIASTGFFHLRPKVGISTEFLLMLMRSQVVQMQLRQQATGGILSTVPDSRVKYILVPRIEKSVQKEVTAKVKAAQKKHQESIELLAEAKATVERLIEAAADRM